MGSRGTWEQRMNRFDAETHKYFIQDVCVPSVTQVLKECGIIDDRFYTEEARERGKAVHLATQLLDEDDLDWDSLDPSLEGYVRAYERFKTESGFVPVLIEERVYNPVSMYAGTLDRTGYFSNIKNKTLIDIKSGAPEPWAAIQTAAYEHCLLQRFSRHALQLKPDGTYRLSPQYRDPNDIKLFLSALSIVHWKRNHGGKNGSSNEIR